MCTSTGSAVALGGVIIIISIIDDSVTSECIIKTDPWAIHAPGAAPDNHHCIILSDAWPGSEPWAVHGQVAGN